jgi:hypothetical protein
LVFFISGILRLLVSTSLLRSFQEARSVEQAALHQLLWELPFLKPLAQLVAGPLPRTSK